MDTAPLPDLLPSTMTGGRCIGTALIVDGEVAETAVTVDVDAVVLLAIVHVDYLGRRL